MAPGYFLCSLSYVCEEKYFVAMNYITMFVNIRKCSLKLSHQIVQKFSRRDWVTPKPKGNFGICGLLSNVPVLGKHC